MSGKRRAFLKTASVGAVASGTVASGVVGPNKAAAHCQTQAANALGYSLPAFSTGSTLLFQGDSITDMKWGRNQADRNHYLGHSYVFLIAARLHTDMPDAKLNFLNRGMSGHTVPDLQKRWQKDALDLKPDLLSILIGINDIGRAIRSGQDVDTRKFETGYRELLIRSRTANPSLRVVLLEPFALPVKRDWRPQVERFRPIVKKLAAEFDAVHVPLQDVFDKAAEQHGPEHWIWDGVHPLPQGHELIARNWISQVAKRWHA